VKESVEDMQGRVQEDAQSTLLEASAWEQNVKICLSLIILMAMSMAVLWRS
jgi:hypothetical protein